MQVRGLTLYKRGGLWYISAPTKGIPGTGWHDAGGVHKDGTLNRQQQREITRRRNFGIISHPDAGKTTLTEKLLLFGGAIQQAGAVRARKASRHALSDWMEMEKDRGISVTTSVMKFAYRDYEINLLDTPGHQDFSEDTYRVLTAVDSALMVIDSGKGVEPQTEKLMDVCRMRNTPIMTFINKLDRDGLPPLDLLADIEDKLAIECVPLTWPVGMGKLFEGVYNRYRRSMHLFTAGGDRRVRDGVMISDRADGTLDRLIGSRAAELRADLELLDGAAGSFSLEAYLAGRQTPVFFGSAVNNFGVRELLDALVEMAPAPLPRDTLTRTVYPHEQDFSGFVFKIQANMDPSHRDRIAFLRVCSGTFRRGLKVIHHRVGKEMTVANATIFMSQDRSNVEEAWPGDIIGIHNHGTIKIGDTFTEKEPLVFTGIPNFAPEHFRRIRLRNPMKMKQLQKGLVQLAEEGAIQVFRPRGKTEYILGAVGALQFDVVARRLKDEYGAETVYEEVPYAVARWVSSPHERRLREFEENNALSVFYDAEERPAFLASSEWRLEHTREAWPDIVFHASREKG